MLRRATAILAALVVLTVPATAASQRRPSLTSRQARQAIHRADAYAFIGRCHRTPYSVVCNVTHQIEARNEDGAPGTAVIYLTDRVHRESGRVLVSTIWEGTVSVSV